MNRLLEGISVVISAWQAQDFIEECLDSILGQWKYIEVILGVDGCRETMRKVMKIQNKYSQLNLSVYWFPENTGVYITTNTLITLAKYNNILTFGADDVMLPNMVKIIMTQGKKYNMVKFKMLNFYDDNSSESYIYKNAAEGCRFFDKRMFMLVGGYMPWRHTGDSEFITRIKPILSEIFVQEVLFKRRLHPKALTIAAETCIGSPEREEFKAKISCNFNQGIIQIPMVCNNWYRLIPAKKVSVKMLIDDIREFGVTQYLFYSGDSRCILQQFFKEYKYVITYTNNNFDHKELPIIRKYYQIIGDKLVYNKHLTLWKRLK